jgi:hypothetical protein
MSSTNAMSANNAMTAKPMNCDKPATNSMTGPSKSNGH